MAAPKSNKKYLNVAVYWGGAELGRCSRPLKGSRGVTAGNGFLCDIKSVIWPRWDELEVIIKTKSGLVLNPNLPWDGVISDGRETHILNSLKPSRKLIEITSATTASLRIDELAVAIRVGTRFKNAADHIKPIAGYGASAFSLIADKPFEWISLGIAFAAAGVLTLSAHSTLRARGNDVYTSINELPGEALLPFLSQRHLAEAPDVIQSGLDRFNYIHSVWDYYSDFGTVVGYGGSPEGKKSIFPTTIDTYKDLKASQSSTLKAAETRQRSQLANSDDRVGTLSIPMVLGESLDGRALRVLDKISLITETSKQMAKRRNEVAKEFGEEIGYSFDAKNGESATNEKFAQISAGFLGLESDDKMQISQAKGSATRAALRQMDLFGKERLVFGAVGCCDPIVGAPLTQNGLVWLPPSFSPTTSTSLAALKASTWGEPIRDVPRIKEPVIGHIEPADVERTVSAGRYQLRLCYELALRRNQTAKGSMEWKWMIDSRGKIANIDLLKSSIRDDELVRCVRDKIASWHFPKPRGGSVEVRYPFEFSRDKG